MEPIWLVYDSYIEITLEPISERQAAALMPDYPEKLYPDLIKELDNLPGQVCSHSNCNFKFLHHLFGADVIGYLFDKRWLPTAKPVPTICFPRDLLPSDCKISKGSSAIVRPFRPGLFLGRLSVLEKGARQLKDGANAPILLPEMAAYFRRDGGKPLERFSEEQHRLKLEISLSELRDFGEFGWTHRQEPLLSANIVFNIPYGSSEMETLIGVRREPGERVS